MKNKKILTAVLLAFLVLVYAFSYGANFKLVGDVLDNFGGKASSTNFSLRISSGGQPSPVTKMASTNFQNFSGFVPAISFWHGDCNGDGSIDLADVVYLARYVLLGGASPRPMESGAVNDLRAVCDNEIDLVDAIYLARYVLLGGPSPCNL
jgi:hypothetical protein